jgi:TonB family protein
MKTKKILPAILCAGITFASFPAPAEAQEYSIEYRVFRGSAAAKQAAPGPVVVTASFADPVFISAEYSSAEEKTDADRIAVLKAELSAIYKLADIEMVRSSRIVWDGKKESLSEVLLIGGDFFPISLSPRKLEGRRVSMGVQIRRYRDAGSDSAAGSARERPDEAIPSGGPAPVGLDKWETVWGSGDRIADSEMTARLDETVVLGFPLRDSSFFISFRVRDSPEDRFWREMVDRIQQTERSWPSGLAVPPKPRFRLIPAFPEGARDHGIEGLVVLKVTVDPEGCPINVHVAKGASISLNQAALAALKQWQFEPVFEHGKAVGTTFFISFDFRRGAGETNASVPIKRDADR